MHQIYSDISIRHGVVGYCFVVLLPNKHVHWESGVLPSGQSAVSAEIMTSALALEYCVGNGVVRVNSDIDDLIYILTHGTVSYMHAVQASVDRLRLACKHVGHVQFYKVDRQNPYYKACHKRARKVALAEAQRRGLPAVQPEDKPAGQDQQREADTEQQAAHAEQ